MFGFRRREWRHARKSGLDFVRELLTALCLVALIVGTWISVGGHGMPGRPEEDTAAASQPAEEPEIRTGHGEPAVIPTEPEIHSLGTPAPDGIGDLHKYRKSWKPGDPDSLYEEEHELEGLDPVAAPELFDILDMQDAPAVPYETEISPSAGLGETATPAGQVETDSLDRNPARLEAMDIASIIPKIASPEKSIAEENKPAPAAKPESEFTVVVEKKKHLLTLYKKGKAVKRYKVAVGLKPGNKKRAGDMRTPEGVFPIQKIHSSGHWVHDFGDGNGVIAGAYGPLFIRLHTPPWNGIGIHGTHDPDSLGSNATEGCIRMKNDELREFAAMIDVGTTVIIK